MLKKADFDELIKNNIKKALGQDVFGYHYHLPKTRTELYGNYYRNDVFVDFIEEMKSSLYQDLVFGKENDFGFEVMNKPNEEEFEILLRAFGIEKSHSMFDIKQFLCHLLGIASQKRNTEYVTLVYLFFKPKTESEGEKKTKLK